MSKTNKSVGDLLIFSKGFVPDPGGLEVYGDEVAKAWADLGFRVTVITQFDGQIGQQRRGIVNVVNVGRGRQIAVLVRMIRAALSLRASVKPVLIHATTWRVAVPAILVFPKTRLAVTVHGREVTETGSLFGWLMRGVISRADDAIVISQSTFDQCKPYLPGLQSKAVISWNGLSHIVAAQQKAKEWKREDSIVRLFTLCRLVPRKNIDGVIRALGILKSRGIQNWHYSVAGVGDELEKLKHLTKKLDLGASIEFLGRVPDGDVANLYREADLFLHPQTAGRDGRDIEGFGLVLVDAMSFGIPVVAGIHGAPREFIRHGETGYLVDGYDGAALVNLLEELLTNRGDLERIGSNGRDWVLANLRWTDHVQRLLVKIDERQ